MLADKLGGKVTEFFLPRDFGEFCCGCTNCFMKGEEKCPHYEKLDPITKAVDEADVLILTSPVYVYHCTGSMKAWLDHYGWRWIVHRPEEKMFSKRAVVISTAAGAGMKSTNRDMADSLSFWGVPKIYKIGFGIHATSWSKVSDKMLAKIRKKTDSIAAKLESWGGKVLVRPDPQIIWKSPKRSDLWTKADGIYHRSSKGGGEWEYRKRLPESWNIGYKNLKFIIRPMGFKHTGLFPEQAVNWDFMADKIRNADREIKVLNLFAYTGGATLACAEAGASVSHVDASKGMVQWARENAAVSGLSDKPIRWLVDDCEKFVQREIRRGKTYDAIVMDPPSYGRGPGGEIWKLEDCIYDLVKTCSGVLSDEPLFFLLNSYTTGLSPSVMAYILRDVLGTRFGGNVTADEIGLPVEATGGVLPCGSTAIWQK